MEFDNVMVVQYEINPHKYRTLSPQREENQVRGQKKLSAQHSSLYFNEQQVFVIISGNLHGTPRLPNKKLRDVAHHGIQHNE